jgi:RimJ/RimL family protein N-acetyltransferase
VQETVSGRVVGWAGLFQPPHYDDPELGWILCEWAEGHGFAHEAAFAARDHAKSHWGMGRIISYVDDANVRSNRLAVRLGAERAVTDSFMGKVYHIYHHPEGAA